MQGRLGSVVNIEQEAGIQWPDSEGQAVVLTSRSCQLLAKYKNQGNSLRVRQLCVLSSSQLCKMDKKD